MTARYRIFLDPGDETIAFVQLMRSPDGNAIAATVAHASGEVFSCEFPKEFLEDDIIIDLLRGMDVPFEEIGARVKYLRLAESTPERLNEPAEEPAQPARFAFQLAQGDNMKQVTERMNVLGQDGYDCTQLVAVATGGWVALMRKSL
jgi:hypothetical protein